MEVISKVERAAVRRSLPDDRLWALSKVKTASHGVSRSEDSTSLIVILSNLLIVFCRTRTSFSRGWRGRGWPVVFGQ